MDQSIQSNFLECAGTIRVGLKNKFSAAKPTSSCNQKISKVHAIPTKNRPFILSVEAALGGFVSGQGLGKGSKIQAADGSIVEVAHPPEVSEKRGKVVLQTDKAKFL